MATPFVQGRLRREQLTVTIESVCAHSGQPMRFTLDSEMRFSVDDPGAEPLVFMPQVDWTNFSEPNIIDAY
jgi:hypothetical protein